MSLRDTLIATLNPKVAQLHALETQPCNLPASSATGGATRAQPATPPRAQAPQPPMQQPCNDAVASAMPEPAIGATTTMRGHALQLQVEAELRADPGTNRKIAAEPQDQFRYRIAVATRLDDGAIASCVVRNVRATWDEITQALLTAEERDRERLGERAAIREFDGKQTRAEAEAGALMDFITMETSK